MNVYSRFETTVISMAKISDESVPMKINVKISVDKMLEKHAEVLDIVNSQSTGSCCFTKAYGKYAKGTGSVLQQSGDLHQVFQSLGQAKDGQERLQILTALNLRYFSPTEVSNLLGFPKSFSFPSNSNPRICYRLLGNSLNVTVVALLTSILIKESLP